MKRVLLLVGTVFVLGTAGPVFAATLGNPAAPLKIKEWTKGQPVDVKDGQHIYVVEFWATWCGPCRVSIPHLTELQKKFKDNGVMIVGISIETAGKVRTFVDQQGAKMDYAVAVDDKERTFKDYMTAYGQEDIPHAFVVSKEGRVLWHGHPDGGLDDVLAQIVAGKYDFQAARKAAQAKAALEAYLEAARTSASDAREKGQQLLDQQGKDPEALCAFALAVLDDVKNKNRDYSLVEEALARAEKATGRKTAQVQALSGITHFEKGQQQEGLALLKKAIDLAQDPQEKTKLQNWLRVMEQRKEWLAKRAADGTK